MARQSSRPADLDTQLKGKIACSHLFIILSFTPMVIIVGPYA